MPVAAGELYQFTIVMGLGAATCENVFMLRDRGGAITDDARKDAARLFWHKYRQVISTDCVCQELRLKRVTPVPLDTLIFNPSVGDEGGTVGGGSSNSILCGITTLRTGFSGKSHRGRCYTPGVPSSATIDDNNRYSVAGLAVKDGIWADIMNEFNDATGASLVFALGIYSTLIGGHNPMTVAGWQAVTEYVNRPLLGSQRRRRQGVGI